MTDEERASHDAVVSANIAAEEGLLEVLATIRAIASGLQEARRQYDERLHGR